ncbi:MAG: hypothetical protein ACJ795_19895 [Ktedonobacteraceae bacterium]
MEDAGYRQHDVIQTWIEERDHAWWDVAWFSVTVDRSGYVYSECHDDNRSAAVRSAKRKALMWGCEYVGTKLVGV